jgi:hypothetical protein
MIIGGTTSIAFLPHVLLQQYSGDHLQDLRPTVGSIRACMTTACGLLTGGSQYVTSGVWSCYKDRLTPPPLGTMARGPSDDQPWTTNTTIRPRRKRLSILTSRNLKNQSLESSTTTKQIYMLKLFVAIRTMNP